MVYYAIKISINFTFKVRLTLKHTNHMHGKDSTMFFYHKKSMLNYIYELQISIVFCLVIDTLVLSFFIVS